MFGPPCVVVRGTILGILSWAALSTFAAGQGSNPQTANPQTTTGVRRHGASDGFYERMGTSWGVQGRGWSLSFGGGQAIPPFGGYSPGGGMTGGWYFNQPGLSGHFGFEASQGSSRTATSVSPTITGINGVPGRLFYGSYRPFVMGVVPVVGDYPIYGYPAYGYPVYGYPAYGYPTWGHPGWDYPVGGYYPGTWYPPGAWYPGMGFTPGVSVQPTNASTPAENSPAARALRQWQLNGRLGAAEQEPPPAAAKNEEGVDDGRVAGNDERLGDGVSGLDAIRPARPGERSSAERPAPSVAEAKRLFAEEQAKRADQAEDLFRQGEAAEASGDRVLAKAFYRKAAQRASGSLKDQALQRLLALREPPALEPKAKR